MILLGETQYENGWVEFNFGICGEVAEVGGVLALAWEVPVDVSCDHDDGNEGCRGGDERGGCQHHEAPGGANGLSVRVRRWGGKWVGGDGGE